jgi:glycosyltransferase involved in cell wall biosynthesis
MLMKMAYIANVRIPTEKTYGYQICKMCEEFAGHGVEVQLWVPAREGNIKGDAFFFYGLKKNFSIREISGLDFYKYLEDPGKLSFWFQGFLFLVQLMFVRIDKEAIVYARDAEISWIFRWRGYRTVFEAHNWPNKSWLYKFLIGSRDKGNKIVSITRGLKEFFLKNNWPESRILVAPDGVDLAKFDIATSQGQARQELGLPPGKKVVLYIGHLYEWKGAQDLAEAASLLDSNYLTIFVGGVASDVEAFKAKNQKLIEDGKIVVHHHQSREAMPRWLKAADVLVLPNKSQEKISSQFTSPLKLFEYMASRRPIVASDLPSIREVLNEKNCLFFKPDDARDLAAKIMFLSENQELVEQIVYQAYLDVQNFTWQKRAENIIKFIADN